VEQNNLGDQYIDRRITHKRLMDKEDVLNYTYVKVEVLSVLN
jgi:hypothetical protein